jgi:hypothetical protein
MGEKWVAALVKEELVKAGRPDLTAKVIWASEDIGDGLGYDIEAVDEQGRPLFIEVKATNQGPEAPFFISQTELAVSEQKGESYKLYRVFNLAEAPRVYVVSGPLREKLRLEARIFVAWPI